LLSQLNRIYDVMTSVFG